MQNTDFINGNCEICGRKELVRSIIELTCNYGSKHDGEQMTMLICGECADKLYEAVKSKALELTGR